MLYSFSNNERDIIIAALDDYIEMQKAECDIHEIPYEDIEELQDAESLYNKLKEIRDME